MVRSPDREQLAQHLGDQGVETLIHYPVPPHAQPAYEEFADLSLPVAERLSGEVLSLPMGPHLTMGQVDMVIDALEFLQGRMTTLPVPGRCT